MRISTGIILIGTALWLAAGCAQRDPVITASPTPDELPEIIAIHRALPATVVVAGRGNQPRVRLAPSFEEPELTPEERAALGEDTLDFQFLLYPDPPRSQGSTVGTWLGGVRTANQGTGGARVLYTSRRSVAGVTGRGGAATGIDPSGSRVSGVGPAREGTSIGGPRGGIKVEIDSRAGKVAQRKPRIER